jgi:hypothetical protein
VEGGDGPVPSFVPLRVLGAPLQHIALHALIIRIDRAMAFSIIVPILGSSLVIR